VHSFYSPIGWHFGHIGRTEEFWVISEALGQPVLDEQLSFLLADLPENPKDNRVTIPDRPGILRYMHQTRERVVQALENADLESPNPLTADGYGWEFALQHECQHQETIAEMLTLIHKALEPSALPRTTVWPEWTASVNPEWIDTPGGRFWLGSDDRHGYDNEKSAHQVWVVPFSVAKYPVTAYEWSGFLRDGGYQNPALWSEDGWGWRCSEDVRFPEYWIEAEGRFAIIGAAGIRPIHPDEPVSSISWYEAEAYAKWSGARLPTEIEREYVASRNPNRECPRIYPWGDEAPDSTRAASGLHAWEPGPVGSHPAGASAFGVEDLAGGVWEWTGSPFLPYPGFEAFPYDGYSKDHMLGEHRVCRGGSWATADPILRCSFRNWYVPSYRQGFLGLRLAKTP
jgi:iron(II)-dependent oxidoreductase